MTKDLLIKKYELEQRKKALESLKAPVIQKRELFSMKKRPRRLEIKRYKKEVQRQISAYKEQLRRINLYLEKNGEVAPKVQIHPFPRIKKTKAARFVRRFW